MGEEILCLSSSKESGQTDYFKSTLVVEPVKAMPQ
jgi:hypothetical protein